MSPSTSQSLPTGKDPPGASTTTTTRPSSIASPRLPYAALQPSQQAQEAQEAMPARPPFTPFFTLVDDASSSSTHHPVNVRYIFSDDDDQDLTDDFLAAISGEPSPQSSSHIMQSSSSITSSQRPSARDAREPEHRTILVDLDATGTAVTSAHSLSSSWQVLSASVTKAPTWESGPTAADNNEEDGASARFMLRLEGTKGRDERMRERIRGVWKGGGRAEDFQVLVEEFERKMRVLKTVVDTGKDTLGGDEPEDGVEDDREHEHEHEHEGEGEKEGDGEGEAEKEGQGQ
ncbi:hypothetical protein V498_06621 [Pseudogymnoascus sp. VKM F-4517 (FW-2822)]|nr:hypothetical protein V498_06621 [Pseudogymnoascus sp. VKM F-4517 (FW-2822)]